MDNGQPRCHRASVPYGKPRANHHRCQNIAFNAGVAAEGEIAEGIAYVFVLVFLNSLHDMGVMPYHKIRSRVNERVRSCFLLGNRSGLKFNAPMAHDNNYIVRFLILFDLAPQGSW